MHPLHDHIAKQLGEKLADRRIVVWYDGDGEFQPFVEELRGAPRTMVGPREISIAGKSAALAEYMGSLFELRSAVEPLFEADEPGALVLYLPGVAHDAKGSVLMELETAGRTWKPDLKQVARDLLLQRYTLGVVDELLSFERKVSYADLARAAAGRSGTEPPSILKSIFHDVGSKDDLLTVWLVSDERDAEIVEKDAVRELGKLVKARLGLDVAADAPLAKLRAVILRYVLAGEFRLDLACDPPASLEGIPRPSGPTEESALRDVARRLRSEQANAYATLAVRVEEELGLKTAKLLASALGSVDTFRFEERAILRHAGELVASSEFGAALSLVAERQHSFWLDRDVTRKAQWEAMRLVAELGIIAVGVKAQVAKASGDAAAWLDAYVAQSDGGWFRLDQAQRRMEAWIAKLGEDFEERPLAVVRRSYEEAVHAMAQGFTSALVASGWTVKGSLHQTRIWSEVVEQQPKPTAYFLVDAMRFEMGVELADRLPSSSEVAVRAAVTALPSITPIGMAALMPGAEASFTIAAEKNELGARIDEAFLPGLSARKKHASGRVPKLVDMTLDDLLSLQPSKLARKVEGAQVVVVRSQEIDHAGENGFSFQARQVMDAVIDNLVYAIRKLAKAGIERSVVSADHGHLFYAEPRDESMRTDAPGGGTVDLHRRCWIGRGGTTPPGAVRVSATSLGYASDLDLVFPAGSGVFRAGGDLAFHHGGTSLQEMVVPVLTVRTPRSMSGGLRSDAPVAISGVPDEITNRMVVFKAQSLLGAAVAPVLLSGGRRVGGLFGIYGAGEADKVAGTVTLAPGAETTIVMLLEDDTVPDVTLLLAEPASDLDVFRSPKAIPVRLLK